MNKRANSRELERLIDKHIATPQVGNLLRLKAKGISLIFPDPQIGAGFIQWPLPPGKWISFSDATTEQQSLVANAFTERMGILRERLSASPISDKLLTFPDNSFLFFQDNGTDDMPIAVTGWGHKYYGLPAGGQFEGINFTVFYQQVDISFLWDGQRMAGMAFKLNGLKRETGKDGFLHVDRKLKVGDSFPMELSNGQHLELKVEKGKQLYEYDLTQYATAEIHVTLDNAPKANQLCELSYERQNFSVTTNDMGIATQRLSLAHDADGHLLQPMPSCVATCNDEQQQQVPQHAGDTIIFRFELKSPPPIAEPKKEPEKETEKEPEEVQQFVRFRILDFAGYPLPDMPFVLKLKKKGKLELKTDAEGYCSVPHEYFSRGEKIKVEFEVTPEYMASHDLHHNNKR